MIPAMDRLDSHLNPRTNQLYHPAIQATMELARKKMNHYYSMTDLSSAYQIAMGKQHAFLLSIIVFTLLSVLHPGLKLEYFRQEEWEDEWIDNETDLVRNAYVSRYEGKEYLAAPISTGIDKPVS